MRRLLGAALVACVWMTAGRLAAADLERTPAPAVPRQPYVAPLYDWTGFYFGAHGGPAWSSGTVRDPTGAIFAPPGTGVNVSGSGWLAGGQIGYNTQLGAWVFGLEGDLSYTDIRGTTTSPFGVNVSTRLDWLGTVTGRLGIAWDRTLLYAKAGAAFGETSVSAQLPLAVVKGSDTRAGWTVGAGAEYALPNNWSVKAEYNYIDLGTRTITAPTPAGPPLAADTAAREHIVKFGANYKFGW